jgi:hypothetical protein
MNAHPVQLQVEPAKLHRIHVAVRLVLLCALAMVGCSSMYWLLYLAVPALVALMVSGDGAQHYLGREAPAFVRALRWLAGAYAYLWLLTDAVPTDDASGPVQLEMRVEGVPTAGSALSRLVTSLPALLLLALMSLVATPLWIVGAVCILAVERMPAAITDFITMKLRYQFRLVAYHLSLVDAYPVVSDTELPHAPHSHPA